jgi:hypothetical protein
MGRAWCDKCGDYVQAGGQVYYEEEECEIKGVRFAYNIMYYKCPVCGEPVLDSKLCDEDTHAAYLAYVEARNKYESLLKQIT